MITICPNAVGRRENTTQVGMSKQTRMKNTRSLARGVWRQGWEGRPQLDIIRSASVSFLFFCSEVSKKAVRIFAKRWTRLDWEESTFKGRRTTLNRVRTLHPQRETPPCGGHQWVKGPVISSSIGILRASGSLAKSQVENVFASRQRGQEEGWCVYARIYVVARQHDAERNLAGSMEILDEIR